MVDQTIEHFNSTMADHYEVEDIAKGGYSSILHSSPGSTVLGLLLCASMLAIAFYTSHRYTVGEREELAEAERRRIEEEKQKEQEIETYRSKIAKIIESYAIHLTTFTSRSTTNQNNADIDISNKFNTTRQIPKASEDEEIEVDSIRTESDSSEEFVTDIEAMPTADYNKAIDSLLPTAGETTCIIVRPTVKEDTDDRIEDEESINSQQQSLSNESTNTSINLREAVADNPCPICLEPFRSGDAIVCCSNNVIGQKPHVFHQACSYDYIINHSEGVQAPCPMCRKLLLPSENQRKACFKNSHSLELTLPGESGTNTLEDSQESNAQAEV